ncbi:hypothetical protein RhiirA1_465497 [Rhizophagus irregularis]|uniref:F-box domain-containing protein n=2 Tax=Rhizophagus irregularis TaxID=588596 RepID=A0A2N0RFV2_9GLOM|nr:hypothetical protein RhiirA1_465497 [Rhizophagus irregularis]
MPKLNRDILYLIFEKFQNDDKTLYPFLSVNKTWCEIIIPILWRNPWKYLINGNENLLLNVIISHLSEESLNNLKIQGIDLFTSLPQKPLFNYICFCKHLDLSVISTMVYSHYSSKYTNNIPIIRSEIFNLFINENIKVTHLYLPRSDYQIHLVPGAKHCFSELTFLRCNSKSNNNFLTGLAEICQSIKELEITIEARNNGCGITKLIDSSKKLINVRLIVNHMMFGCIFPTSNSDFPNIDDEFHIKLENSLMKHANTIQYFKIAIPPVTRILSSLVNLKELELSFSVQSMKLDNLENISLPNLRFLKSNVFQFNILRNLIVNTNRSLTKISVNIVPHNVIDNNCIIQAIYQNCPNLMYLKLLFMMGNMSELEQLLINCQYLNGIYFLVLNLFDLDELFEKLTKLSPYNLFKFKFNIISCEPIKLESLKLFFDNWKSRNPMLLQIDKTGCADLIDFIEEYKSEGIIKKFNKLNENNFEDFEW